MRKRQPASKRGVIAQVAVVEVFANVESADRTAVRPFIGIARVLDGPVSTSAPAHPEDSGPHLAIEAIECLAEEHGVQPHHVQVRDEVLAAHLGTMLGPQTRVEVLESLPGLDAVVRDLEEFLSNSQPALPSPLDVPGVTTADLAALAEAAGRFWRAAPWTRLDWELDPILVETPRPDPTLHAVSVRGGDVDSCGLLVLEDPDHTTDPGDDETYSDSHAMWFLELSLPHETPRADLEIWERHSLPRAGERIPYVFCAGPKDRVRRASPRILAFFSGLLDAIASATDEQLDSGRWSMKVDTRLGPQTFTLALPSVLELDSPERKNQPFSHLMMEQHLQAISELVQQQSFESIDETSEYLERVAVGKRFEPPSPRTPQETARQLAYRAIEEQGRARTALAHRALALDPDSSDALVALSMNCHRSEDAVPLLEQAVATAERSLGRDFAKLRPGDFWIQPRTRPYMRARLDLATALAASGELNRAIGHYSELLRLNPEDNQGVRDRLFPVLMQGGELAVAETLLKQYEFRGDTHYEYDRALLRFAQGGDGTKARNALKAAFEANLTVAELLVDGFEELPAGKCSPGSRGEAEVYVFDCLEAWRAVLGALDWLIERLESPPPHRQARGTAPATVSRAGARHRGR